ncbi:AAA family ATPase [Ramlibacter sp.]|uniref:AAA family ATPase n=1 Tax=Ramlibacter sp. TaxID=1917967 RepID=UPI003D0CE115
MSAALIGREAESLRLRAALADAAGGACRVVLVAGDAGIGKSVLVRQLAPWARACGGRFVLGKFEQHNEREAVAILDALGTLGELLLDAADAEERDEWRGRLLRVLGAEAGLARILPGFGALLCDVPDARAVDPSHVAARLVGLVIGLLRAIASPAHPLVFALDDLQWSGSLATRLIDAVLAAGDLPGLLLVGAVRGHAVADAHPMAGALERWTAAGSGVETIALGGLPPEQVARLVAPVLRIDARCALAVAHELAPFAAGNPYDSAEAAQALRGQDFAPAVLRDAAAVRRFLASTTVDGMVAARLAMLPPPARELLQSLACIGTRTAPDVARAAAGLPPSEFDAMHAMLVAAGFVHTATEAGTVAVVLRHDRVQRAAYESIPPPRRPGFHLALARRLAAREDMQAVAADQYVDAAPAVTDAEECLRAARLLRMAAVAARRLGNSLAACRMLAAGLRLAGAAPQARAELARCEIEYHLALQGVGRLEEADEMYARIERRGTNALARIDAACAQADSLTNRDRMHEAIALGLDVLRELGLCTPPDFAADAGFPARLDGMRRWIAGFDLERERERAEAADPRVVAAARMIERLLMVAVLKDIDLLAWLIFESQRLWEAHGPCASLAGSLGRAGSVAIVFSRDWQTGYRALRQALDLCAARGWSAEGSLVRYLFVLSGVHWFEPLERAVAEAERAREGLLAAGDLRNASFSQRQSAIGLLECGPDLRRYAAEVDAALTLSVRAGNVQAIARCAADRALIRALTGEAGPAAAPAALRQPRDPDAIAWLNPYEAALRAIACAIFGDAAGLSRHAPMPDERPPRGRGFYPLTLYQMAWSHWLAGLAAAWELQDPARGQDSGAAALERLDACIEWLRQRAVDAPLNFRHMHRHLRAERAWAVGDLSAAARAFDEAQAAVELTTRPWHEALITERSARLHLRAGWAHSGAQLLEDACRQYAGWGAAAKVVRLRIASHGELASGRATRAERTPPPGTPPPVVLSADIDALAILRAAQIFGAERAAPRLAARIEELLCCMAGATRAVLALWDEPLRGWVDGGDVLFAADRVPMTALRYVRRTRAPLRVDDALADERFSREPCLRAHRHCSMLVLPLPAGAEPRAVLYLEHDAVRHAFGTLAPEAVTTLAEQLAVSLESARLNARMERQVREQTALLRRAQAQELDDARRAGMAQIATNVLHNVGNVLTSVNVSAHVLADRVRDSRSARVGDLCRLLEAELPAGGFFAPGGKGRLLPSYMRQLAQALQEEREGLLGELAALAGHVEHIRNVVAMQQSHAVRVAGGERRPPPELKA